jgi:predicted nucleic acid-binding protein
MEKDEVKVIYLDANAFILAMSNIDELGEKARLLLGAVQEGRQKAATSALTFDEVAWKILQLKNFDEAIIASNYLLKMPNLTFLDVNVSTLSKSSDLMMQYKLYPRDSIHAACALNNDILIIVSEDRDFDNIKGLERKSIKDFKIQKTKV